MRLLSLLAVCTLLAACGFVHKIDVQQGNYVTQDAIAKMKNGMTKAEVKAVLGTPLLIDIFHANRWDYSFSQVKGGKAAERKLFSVFFESDKVVSFGGSAQPPAAPPVGQASRPTSPPEPVTRPAPRK